MATTAKTKTWKDEVWDHLVSTYPDHAEAAMFVVATWGDIYPFGDMPTTYAALNAAEEAGLGRPTGQKGKAR